MYGNIKRHAPYRGDELQPQPTCTEQSELSPPNTYVPPSIHAVYNTQDTRGGATACAYTITPRRSLRVLYNHAMFLFCSCLLYICGLPLGDRKSIKMSPTIISHGRPSCVALSFHRKRGWTHTSIRVTRKPI